MTSTRVSPAEHARGEDYSTWSLAELQDHLTACVRVAAEQRAWNQQDHRTSTKYEQACRRSARRYANEIAKREKEQTK